MAKKRKKIETELVPVLLYDDSHIWVIDRSTSYVFTDASLVGEGGTMAVIIPTIQCGHCGTNGVGFVAGTCPLCRKPFVRIMCASVLRPYLNPGELLTLVCDPCSIPPGTVPPEPHTPFQNTPDRHRWN